MVHNDAMHLPITTGSAFLIYGWTLEEIVLTLWMVYVLILIVNKIPELHNSIQRIKACLQGRGKRVRKNDESKH